MVAVLKKSLFSASSHVTAVSKFTIEVQDRRFYLNHVLQLWHSAMMVFDS